MSVTDNIVGGYDQRLGGYHIYVVSRFFRRIRLLGRMRGGADPGACVRFCVFCVLSCRWRFGCIGFVVWGCGLLGLLLLFLISISRAIWCVGERIVALRRCLGRCIILIFCAYGRVVATSCNIARVDGGPIGRFTP